MYRQTGHSHRTNEGYPVNRRSSVSSKYSQSSSKRKYLDVVSKKSPSKNNIICQNNLRGSAISIRTSCDDKAQKKQNFDSYMSRSCVKDRNPPQSLSRSNSQMSIPNSYQVAQKIIIREIIRPLPVNFSYPNCALINVGYQNQRMNSGKKEFVNLQKPYQNYQNCQTPSKRQIIVSEAINLGILGPKNNCQPRFSYSHSHSHHKPPQKVINYENIAPSRFSLKPDNSKTSHGQWNPPRTKKDEQASNKNIQKSSIPTQSRELRQIINRQNSAYNLSSASKKVLSNQVYMKQEVKISDFSSSQNTQEFQKTQDNEGVQKNVIKYDSLTIKKEDRLDNLKENLQIGKNCLCSKILQFTRCEDIKIKNSQKNRRQALQPKKNLLY